MSNENEMGVCLLGPLHGQRVPVLGEVVCAPMRSRKLSLEETGHPGVEAFEVDSFAYRKVTLKSRDGGEWVYLVPISVPPGIVESFIIETLTRCLCGDAQGEG